MRDVGIYGMVDTSAVGVKYVVNIKLQTGFATIRVSGGYHGKC